MQPIPLPDPSFAQPSVQAAAFDPDAVESAGASVANGLAANAGRFEPDPDWQPV